MFKQVKNQVALLDTVQFCYNLHQHSLTDLCSTELTMQHVPKTSFEIVKQRGRSVCLATFQVAQDKQKMIEEAQDSLAKAAQRMKKYADKNMRDVQIGDKVMLKLTPQIWKKISSKTVHLGLVQKYGGHFEIIKRVENVAYQKQFPNHFKVRPTFHISYLKPFNESLMSNGQLQARGLLL